ncbi:MAG: hypothetical protein AAB635_01190 [Patescibacteria group bacterium]
MSDEVKFEEEEILIDRASQISRRSTLAGFIMQLGLAKTESQATYILIGIIVASLLATIFVISRYLV